MENPKHSEVVLFNVLCGITLKEGTETYETTGILDAFNTLPESFWESIEVGNKKLSVISQVLTKLMKSVSIDSDDVERMLGLHDDDYGTDPDDWYCYGNCPKCPDLKDCKEGMETVESMKALSKGDY